MRPTLQEEIRQRKPFGSAEEEAMLSIARTAAVLEHAGGEMLKAHGLTPTQYNALRILRGAGEAGLSCREIGERLVTRDPDITRLLDRLEAAGLVARKRCREDRRRVLCSITKAGLDVLERSMPTVRVAGRKRSGRLSETELERLLELLDRLREDTP